MKISDFQFLNPYLEEVYFKTNPDFTAFENNEEFNMNNSFHVQVKRSTSTNRATVELTLETNINNEKAPFKLKVKIASDFKWQDLDEETVESLLNQNAPALLLGYMRPIVANLTNSSNFPVYNIPFINFKK